MRRRPVCDRNVLVQSVTKFNGALDDMIVK